MIQVNVPLEDAAVQRKSKVNKTWKEIIMLGLERAEELLTPIDKSNTANEEAK